MVGKQHAFLRLGPPYSNSLQILLCVLWKCEESLCDSKYVCVVRQALITLPGTDWGTLTWASFGMPKNLAPKTINTDRHSASAYSYRSKVLTPCVCPCSIQTDKPVFGWTPTLSALFTSTTYKLTRQIPFSTDAVWNERNAVTKKVWFDWFKINNDLAPEVIFWDSFALLSCGSLGSQCSQCSQCSVWALILQNSSSGDFKSPASFRKIMLTSKTYSTQKERSSFSTGACV